MEKKKKRFIDLTNNLEREMWKMKDPEIGNRVEKNSTNFSNN